MKFKSMPLIRWGWPFLAGILLVGIISYINPNSGYFKEELPSGRYRLEAFHNGGHNALKGPVYFEYTGQKEGFLATRIFKLHFANSMSSEGEAGFGFLIPLSDTGQAIEKETYRVDPANRGFMNGLESVFGYADLREVSPSLYFTESGSISIVETNAGEVAGSIDLVLDNGSGGSIHLEGDFRALPLPSNLSP